MNFEEAAGYFLMPYKRLHFTEPVSIDITYYIKGKYHSDIDNAISSVFDCFTHYGIIADDDLCYQVSARKVGLQPDWLCVIKIDALAK
jgi:Holliday junction resolvase RusA-like endonuclease